jgi:hypothetical protein
MRVLRAFKEGLMRFAIIAAGALAASAVVLSGNTARADATPTGIEVGLRSGYAIPMGDAAGGSPSTSLSNVFSGVIPIWVDAGYRFNPNMMVGAFFQYGIAMLNTGSGSTLQGCGQNGVSCSGSDMMFGAQFHYHLMPDQTIDPWAGVGIGYEIATANLSSGNVSGSQSLSGFQFFNLQIGGDYKVMPNLGIGPFVMFSLGSYGNCNTSVGGQSQSCPNYQSGTHEWLTFGIRGAYDINL